MLADDVGSHPRKSSRTFSSPIPSYRFSDREKRTLAVRGVKTQQPATPEDIPNSSPNSGTPSAESYYPELDSENGADMEPFLDPELTCGGPCVPNLENVWVRAEYLYWWTDPMNYPPLVTSSPVGTATNVAGVLGQPGTRTLLNSEDLGDNGRSGARFTLGWDCPDDNRGIYGSYFQLGNRTANFFASSAAIPILARPVFDTETNAEAAMLVAHPALLTGFIGVEASSEFKGGEAMIRNRLISNCQGQLDFLIGYRFVRLDESLRISQSSTWTAAQGAIVAGTRQDLFDSFDTNNRFNGAAVGFAYRQALCCWTLDFVSKIAIGQNHSEVVINGQTVSTVPNAGSATFVGGLLAQQTNIGTYENNRFGFVPELSVSMRRDLTSNLHFTVGYDLLFWTGVHRPGDQIDRNVSQFPPEVPTGTFQPAFTFHSRDFFAQGLHAGLEYRF